MPSRDDTLAVLLDAGNAAAAIERDLTVCPVDVVTVTRPASTIMLCCRRGQERYVIDVAARINEKLPAALADRLRMVAAGRRIFPEGQ